MNLTNYVGVVEVVKGSSCLPSTQTIRVRITPSSTFDYFYFLISAMNSTQLLFSVMHLCPVRSPTCRRGVFSASHRRPQCLLLLSQKLADASALSNAFSRGIAKAVGLNCQVQRDALKRHFPPCLYQQARGIVTRGNQIHCTCYHICAGCICWGT